jgi:hypothetical protein
MSIANRFLPCLAAALYTSKALIKHGLVISHATLRPARYALTRTGFEIATVIAAHEEIPILDVNLEDTLCHEEDPPRAQSRYPDPRKEDPSSSISRDLIPHESNAPVEVKYSAVHLDDKSLRDNLESSENFNCLDTAPEAPLPFRFYYVNNGPSLHPPLVASFTLSNCCCGCYSPHFLMEK